MDSDNDGDRLKEIQICKNDNVENAKESMEENAPKILSPEIRDVFPLFASMISLDIMSYTRLAMTCKDIYKRCTEDNAIKINVDEDRLYEDESLTFHLESFTVPNEHIKSYLAALRKFPCRVNFRAVVFSRIREPYSSIADVPLRWFKETGVESIKELHFQNSFTEFVAIIPFVKNFLVDEVYLHLRVPHHIMKSMLSLNIKKLTAGTYEDVVPIDILLENDSKIPAISFPYLREIEKNQFMQLLQRIQSGSLQRVTVKAGAVNWDDYDMLSFDYDGPLPDERPLILARITEEDFDEFWFLNWLGDVTKCVVHYEEDTLEVFQCEEWEYPWIVRQEKDILKDLAEKRPRVSCTDEQFKKFSSSLEPFSASSAGVVSDARPLFFPLKNRLWFLDEDETLMKCNWEDGCATWENCSSNRYGYGTGQRALNKFLFWKKLKEEDIQFEKRIHCENLEEFDGWLDGYTKLDFDYLGALPRTRPVVFERRGNRYLRVVLFEHRLVQCKFGRRDLRIKLCTPSNSPSVLMTADDLKTLLQRSLKWIIYKDGIDKANKWISYRMLCDGFELFKTIPGYFRSRKLPVVFEKVMTDDDGEISEERWYSDDGANIRKATWKNGRLVISEGEFHKAPIDFIRQLFRMFAERGFSPREYRLHHELFLDCLEQFNVIPFEYDGPLTSDPPLAFMKKEIRQTGHKVPTRRIGYYSSADFFIRVWFLWDGRRATYCSWEEEEKGSRKLSFKDASYCQEIPPVMETKGFLKSLLEGVFEKESIYHWRGLYNDLHSFLGECKTLSFDYDGPLPDVRPLVFKTREEHGCFLLREDGIVVECEWKHLNSGKTSVTLRLPYRYGALPSAINSLSNIVFYS